MALSEKKPNLDSSSVSNESKSKPTLPKSAREILDILQTQGALKPRQIREFTSLSNRTIRYALKILVDDAIIRRIPDLNDLRTHFYSIN